MEITKDNNVLLISENSQKVFLPYKIKQLNDYLLKFPNNYDSVEDVVNKEYILPLKYFISSPHLARFREAFSLSRDREAKPFLESLQYAFDIMFNNKLNPAIIAACRTQEQLSNYIECLENNKLSDFTDFEIRFEVSPL